MSVLFYGDPHGQWQPLLRACGARGPSDLSDAVAAEQPDAVILLGDMDLDEPLDTKLAPLLDAGIDVRWIAGNHDGDDAAWHDRLFHAGRGLDRGDLNASIQTVGGLRVAGLGGVFRRKVWDPNFDPDPNPNRYTRRLFFESLSKGALWRQWLPMKHRVSIFPEDMDTLYKAARKHGSPDVLVTHEAPSAHDKGFEVIDQLARDIGARLVVHGHHHYAYEHEMADGLRVRGLALAEPWWLTEEGVA